MANTLLNSKKWIDIIKYRWLCLTISAILILPGIAAMIYSSVSYPDKMPVRVGIDFTGGTIVQYSVDKAVNNETIADIRTKLEEKGITNPVIQILQSAGVSSDDVNNIISVRMQFSGEKDNQNVNTVSQIIKSDYANAELVQVSSVGPTLGKELFKNSMAALILAFIGIVVYLAFRFQLDYGIITLFSLIHNALFVIGTFSIMGLFFGVQIDALFITAILTVVGFSVHDTIVVFDRIRENCKFLAKKASFGEIVNASVNQTLARSINTSITTLLTLIALYFFGGVTTKDFVLAMILGIAAGTYGSIFFASMILAWYRERKEAKA